MTHHSGAAALLSAVLLFRTLPVGAADANGNYAIWTLGAKSCNQYNRAAGDEALRARYSDFLTGYLTAYNTLAEQTFNALGDMKLDGALGWLDEYCGSHQMDSFERAITQLVVNRYTARRAAGHGNRSWGRVPFPSTSEPAAGMAPAAKP